MCSAKTPIDRCFEIIDLLASDARSVRLGEISDRLDLPKSATHRMLAALCANGWVRQDPQTGFYRLTLRLAVLGQRFLNSTEIPDLCRPILERLASESRELVRLAIVDGDGLLWIDSVQGSQFGLTYQPRQSEDLAPYATAAGQAWLATLGIEQAIGIVFRNGFSEARGLGPKAVHSIEGLMDTLDATRKRGWAVSIEQTEAGVAGVAAAIVGSEQPGEPAMAMGTVSIDVPLVRFPHARRRELGRMIVAAACELSDVWPVRPASMAPAAKSSKSVRKPELHKDVALRRVASA